MSAGHNYTIEATDIHEHWINAKITLTADYDSAQDVYLMVRDDFGNIDYEETKYGLIEAGATSGTEIIWKIEGLKSGTNYTVDDGWGNMDTFTTPEDNTPATATIQQWQELAKKINTFYYAGEQETNETWVNNKKIYKKTFSFSITGHITYAATGLAGCTIVKTEGMVYNSANYQLPIPMYESSDDMCRYYVSPSMDIEVVSGKTYYETFPSSVAITLYYVKNV